MSAPEMCRPASCRDYEPMFKLHGCELGAGHDGSHVDCLGREWDERLPAEPGRCGSHAPWGSGWRDQRCTQSTGHDGRHRDCSGNEWAAPDPVAGLLEAGLSAAGLADEVYADLATSVTDLEDAAGQQGQDIAEIRRDVRQLRGEMATGLDLRTAVTWIAELEELARDLLGRLGLAERRIAVLDRLRPSCAACMEAPADRQTTRGPQCTDCAGDLPGDDDGGAWPS